MRDIDRLQDCGRINKFIKIIFIKIKIGISGVQEKQETYLHIKQSGKMGGTVWSCSEDRYFIEKRNNNYIKIKRGEELRTSKTKQINESKRYLLPDNP